MASAMNKIKDKLHIRSKSTAESGDPLAGAHLTEAQRESIDDEMAAMSPEEREAYLKEFEEADRTGEPKKGSLIDKLIARGNKRTEEQLAQEARERELQQQSRGGITH